MIIFLSDNGQPGAAPAGGTARLLIRNLPLDSTTRQIKFLLQAKCMFAMLSNSYIIFARFVSKRKKICCFVLEIYISFFSIMAYLIPTYILT